jgi:uncharacterized membrane protein
LSHGTTTACYYGTIHLKATKILAHVVATLGQRAFVGKVNMDRNSPDYYVETTDVSYNETVGLVLIFVIFFFCRYVGVRFLVVMVVVVVVGYNGVFFLFVNIFE